MTLWDRILIVFIAVVGILGIFLIPAMQAGAEQTYAVIEVDGRTRKTISLQGTDNSIYAFNFGGENVGYVEVKDGAVRMLEMDKKVCPKRICSETGWINKGYQSIVCLPNRINVKFTSQSDEEIDEISY